MTTSRTFIPWYLRRSVIGRRSGLDTLWSVLAVMLAGCLALFLGSVAYGMRRARLHELASRPFARVLWLGDGVVQDALTPGRLQELRDRLLQEPALEGQLEKLCPFHEIQEIWLARLGHKDRPIQHGRTVTPDDPLLAYLQAALSSGRIFQGPDDEGVILTSGLAELLGVAAAPGEVHLELTDGSTAPIPVVGILAPEVALPFGAMFLLPEAYELVLKTRVPNVPLEQVETAVVPDAWALGKLREETRAELRRTCQNLSLHPPRELQPGQATGWLLRSVRPHDPPNVVQWRFLLKGIHDTIIRAEGLPEAPAFLGLPVQPDAQPRPPARKGFERAGLFVRDVNYLPRALRVCSAVGIPIDLQSQDAALQIEQITAATEEFERWAGLLVSAPGLVGFVGLVFLQMHRSREKTLEYGLLKGLGVPGWQLDLMTVLQATAIWVLGSAAGWLLAFPTLLVANAFWGLPAEAAFRLADIPTWLLWTIALAPWPTCLLSFLFGSWSGRYAAPVVSISMGR